MLYLQAYIFNDEKFIYFLKIWMIGFETIGNATTTFFDDSETVLSTDPWIDGSPYFGSWLHRYNIPKEQKNNIINSKYIWYSHGHPDHLDEKSFKYFVTKSLSGI